MVSTYRRPLHTYCYRMLGSIHDADDALQEILLGAWRGLARFEGRTRVRIDKDYASIPRTARRL